MPLAMRIFSGCQWYVMPSSFAPLALALPVMQSEVHGLVDDPALLPLPVVRHNFCTAFPWTTTRAHWQASPLVLVPCTTWTAPAAAPFTQAGIVNSGMPRELELQVQLEDLNDRVLRKLRVIITAQWSCTMQYMHCRYCCKCRHIVSLNF